MTRQISSASGTSTSPLRLRRWPAPTLPAIPRRGRPCPPTPDRSPSRPGSPRGPSRRTTPARAAVGCRRRDPQSLASQRLRGLDRFDAGEQDQRPIPHASGPRRSADPPSRPVSVPPSPSAASRQARSARRRSRWSGCTTTSPRRPCGRSIRRGPAPGRPATRRGRVPVSATSTSPRYRVSRNSTCALPPTRLRRERHQGRAPPARCGPAGRSPGPMSPGAMNSSTTAMPRCCASVASHQARARRREPGR